MAASRALITFAYVKEAFDKTGDIVQGLIPLFGPVFNEVAGKQFNPVNFTKQVEAFYGIRMHPWVAEDWAPRFEAAGFLTSTGDQYNRTYTCRSISIQENSEASTAVIGLLDSLFLHVSQRLTDQKVSINREDLEAKIISRLQRVDFIALILKPNTIRSSPGTLTLPANRPTPANDIEATLDFILASRIVELYDTDRVRFDLVSSISAGALVSEVVLGLRSPPISGQKATGTIVYLDSPIVIDLLDLGDHRQHEYARLLAADLRSIGAHLRTYEHNVDEIRNIISATLESYGDVDASVGTVAYRLRTDSNAISRAQIIKANIHKKIQDIGIGVVNMDTATKANEKFYPDEDLTDLIAQIRPFADIFSREVDARSVVGVGRQILGRKPVGNVLSLPAIFLTKNASLAKTGNRVLVSQRNYPEAAAPPFLTDRQMAGLLWLALGGGTSSLSQKQLIANCTVAVTPRKDVLGTVYKMLAETDESSARDFELLMTEDRCAHYVMDYTLGDAAIVTRENAFDILEGVKLKAVEKAVESATQALDAEHAIELKILNSSLTEKAEAVEIREQQIQKLIGEAAEREQAVADATKALLDLQKSQVGSAVKVALKFEMALKLLIVVVVSVVVGILGVVSWYFLDALSGVSLMIAVTLVFICSTMLTAILGWVVPDLLFGPFISRRRSRRFDAEVERLGAEVFVGDWEIDWSTGQVEKRAAAR